MASSCVVRLYSHQDGILVLATNCADSSAEIAIEVDPPNLDVVSKPEQLRVYDLNGTEFQKASCPPGPVHYVTTLEPDSLRMLEITP